LTAQVGVIRVHLAVPLNLALVVGGFALGDHTLQACAVVQGTWEVFAIVRIGSAVDFCFLFKTFIVACRA